MSAKLVRNFIVGKEEFISSLTLYKQAMMRGQIAVIMFCIGAIYIVIDLRFGFSSGIPYYVALIIFSSISFWLNRKKHYMASSMVIVLLSNAVIFFFVSSELITQGVSMFFIPVALVSLALFGPTHKNLGYLFAALSYVLFLVAWQFSLNIIPHRTYTPEYSFLNYFINFTFSITASVLIIHFLISINAKSEKTLLNLSEELKKSKQRYELAILGSKSGIWEWDIVNSKVYHSPVWKSMLGYVEHDFPDLDVQNFLDLVHPEDRAEVTKNLMDHMGKSGTYGSEYRLVKKDGSVVWVADSGICVWDEHGKAIQMVGSIIDISERKKAERQVIDQNILLAKANAELDLFVYSVSHDLRAPLSSVKGLIDLAERTTDLTETKTYAGMMRERIDALEKFLKDIVDYSRNARTDVISEKINMYDFVREIIDSLKYSEGMPYIEIRQEILPDEYITCDRLRLKIILSNIVSNAIKYHDNLKSSMFLRISTRKTKDSYQVCVEDNGIGIELHQLPRVFEMFHRASVNSKGSGLGLYIAKETARKMRGDILVSSAFGEGTVFTLVLPA